MHHCCSNEVIQCSDLEEKDMGSLGHGENVLTVVCLDSGREVQCMVFLEVFFFHGKLRNKYKCPNRKCLIVNIMTNSKPVFKEQQNSCQLYLTAVLF